MDCLKKPLIIRFRGLYETSESDLRVLRLRWYSSGKTGVLQSGQHPCRSVSHGSIHSKESTKSENF